jgi:hypothetical protein
MLLSTFMQSNGSSAISPTGRIGNSRFLRRRPVNGDSSSAPGRAVFRWLITLSRLGHTVEIAEAGPVPGGMMHFGIPAYRLPRADLMNEIRRIEEMGVQITLDHRVEDLLREREAGRFDAVFVAVGAQASPALSAPR